MDIDFRLFIMNSSLFEDKPELAAQADLKDDRIYLGIIITINNNNCFVPLETNLKDNELLKRNSQWPVPSSTRPNAGLNFEKSLIVNDLK